MQPDELFLLPAIEEDATQARNGDISATMRLGYRYLTGSAGSRDIHRARSYFAQISTASSAASAWLGFIDVSLSPRTSNNYRAGLERLS